MENPHYTSIQAYKDKSYEKFKNYERFKFIIKIIHPSLKKASSLLDIGCAKGEFFYAIKDDFHDISCTGIELSEDLINTGLAKKELSHVNFVKASALDFDLKEHFDIAIMSGVLSIFDDIDPPLENMANHIKSGGRGFIFSGFNTNNIDVIVRHRNNEMSSTKWESGLNMFSLKTVENSLKRFSNEVIFHKFVIPIDLKPTDNPIQSYTLNTKEQGRIILNGANIIRDFYLIEFKKE